MNEAVILLSGGMDSGVLLALSTQRYERVHALSFDYGSKHAERELEMAGKLAESYGATHKIIKIPFINELFSSSLLKSGGDIPEGEYAGDNITSTVVPFRNGIMLSIAIGYAESNHIDKVLIASHSGDHPIYPDCTNEFISSMSAAAGAGTFTKVEIVAPFGEYTKKQIAEAGRKLDFDFTNTFSCYKGGEIHCGRCATCIERKQALDHEMGLDPTRYLA